MAELFSSGVVAVIIFALMLIEGVALTLLFRRTGKGIAPFGFAWGLAAGAGLVLALFGALVGAHWQWIAAALVLSLAAHVADISLRWTAAASDDRR